MAIIYPDGGQAPTPDDTMGRTHALVIGIGGYTYLEGGTEHKAALNSKIGILPQLTTSPRSAHAFANFVIRSADQWAAPLGSVELLLTLAPGDTFPLPDGVEAGATMEQIQTAYDAWRARCDSHPDNIALFYFCGHGLEKEEQILLAEDFGRSTNNPWRGSFAIDSTCLGFHNCKAHIQCFFIDACREITSPLKNHDVSIAPLESPRLTQAECEHSLFMRSTANKETALGPKDGPAYATQALIRAMEGAAANQEGNRWVIRSGGIADKITDILRLVNEKESFTQRCSCAVTQSTELLTLTNKPRVRLDISCAPDNALEKATLRCVEDVLPNQPTPAPLDEKYGESLRIDVAAGSYVVNASFAEAFKPTAARIWAEPPVSKHVLECEQL